MRTQPVPEEFLLQQQFFPTESTYSDQDRDMFQRCDPNPERRAVSTTKRAWASEIVAREIPIPDTGSVQPRQRQESRGGAQINSFRWERTTWEGVLHVGLVLPSFDR